METLCADIEAALRSAHRDRGVVEQSLDRVSKLVGAGDLDLLRVLARYPTDRMVLVAAKCLRSAKGTPVAPIFVDAHRDVCVSVYEALSGFTEDVRVGRKIVELAFEDMSNVDLILHLIRDRKMVSHETLRESVRDMREQSPAPSLITGAL